MSLAVSVALGVASVITAAISGALGLAGGITLLGVMTALLPAADVVPLHGVAQLCSNLTRTIVFLRDVRWSVFLIYSVPYLVGITFATLVWSGSVLEWFSAAIGLFILLFLVWRRKAPRLRDLPIWTYVPLGLFTGFLAIFVGATGPFIAPFFLRDDFDKEETIATSAMCQAWGHVAKIPAFLSLGYAFGPHWRTLTILVVASVVGTFAGRSILERLSKQRFTSIFEVTLALIAFYLIVTGIAAW